MVSLESALNYIQDFYLQKTNKTFSISFLKCNRKNKTGGEFVTIAKAQKTGLPNHPGNKFMIGIYDHDASERLAVHERLIFKINGEEVYW